MNVEDIEEQTRKLFSHLIHTLKTYKTKTVNEKTNIRQQNWIILHHIKKRLTSETEKYAEQNNTDRKMN